MNNKLLSYEELKRHFNALSKQQRVDKKTIASSNTSSQLRSVLQSIVSTRASIINVYLSAINHAKEARKLYEYKRVADKLRGQCTENAYLPEVD